MVTPNRKKRKRSPKIKKTKNSKDDFIKKIQVPLKNRFDTLGEDENITDKELPPQKQIISPLIVTNHDTDISKITKELEIECQFKILSVGRKITCKSIEDKEKLSKALIDKKVLFFSHPENDNKLFKVVLSGLPEVSINIITECLETEHKLIPSKVILFKTNSPNKLYLCHFNKNEVSLKSLNTITSVYHHIVKWMPYKPKHKGPTQCYRCCMYGHGASTCNRYQVCILCSGNHATNGCPNANNTVYKCFNCASANLPHDHKATDPSCPFRTKYQMARNNARDKNKRNPVTQSHTHTGLHNHKYVAAPTPQPLTSSFASQLLSSSHAQSQPPSKKSTTWNQTQQSSTSSCNNNPSDLFTIEEITDLLFTSINELEKCTSKLEQLRVIANLLRNVYK